jgi:GTP cyclohydrolase I
MQGARVEIEFTDTQVSRRAIKVQDATLQIYAPYDQLDRETVECAAAFLRKSGYDLDKEHSRLSPYRLAHYIKTVLKGNKDSLHFTTFANENPRVDHMVTVPHIPFWAVCSHHLLPFVGYVSVGYIPSNRVVGLSKIPLYVREIALGPWMQEHLAAAIADRLEAEVAPQGVGVQIIAQHTCQLLDLGQPPIPWMITTVVRGALLLDASAHQEFLDTCKER